MAGVLAFDVNETLLDLSALDPLFERAFGDGALRAQWFSLMLQVAFVGGLTGRYVDFTTAQHAALRMLAERQGPAVSDADADEIVDSMAQLPAHPEVAAALGRLRATRLRLVALTNSPLAVARAQLEHAGLAGLLDDAYSADEVRALKPAPAPYRLVAERSGCAVGDVRLVAAHGWDVAGALAAGCSAAFVARPRAVLVPLGPQPDVVGRDLAEVAERILELPG